MVTYSTVTVPDKVERLAFSERWFRDGLLECGLAGSTITIEADVSISCDKLRSLQQSGVAIKWAAVFAKAAALALARHPALNRLVAGNLTLRPSQVDICLSVASDQALTPVVILEDCADSTLDEIAQQIVRLTPLAQEENLKMSSLLNLWGFLGFSAWVRRRLLRFLLSRVWYRRKVSGTFQVSCLKNVDVFTPLRFNTAAVLGVGRVKERPFVVAGALVVRPTVMLTCCFDHAVWNGADASLFLNEVRKILEQGSCFAVRAAI